MTTANRQLTLPCALLLSLALVIMHSFTAHSPAPAHGRHRAGPSTAVATVMAIDEGGPGPIAGCDHDRAGVHSHRCVGIPGPGATVEAASGPVSIIEPIAERRSGVAMVLRAFGGRGPPWTVPSLSQLSILRV